MDNSISREFLTIMNKLRKITHKKHHDTPVHPGEFMMLSSIFHFIKDHNENNIKVTGVTVTELSDIIHSTKSATSKMLNSLEEKGYIERVSDSKDRRIVYIRLTETGEKIIKDSFKRLQDFADRTINRMGEEDARELVRTLNKFYEAILIESKRNSVGKDSECCVEEDIGKGDIGKSDTGKDE